MTLTNEEKQDLRDFLEKAINPKAESKVVIGIEVDGVGVSWQYNVTIGELALAAHNLVASLLEDEIKPPVKPNEL